MATEATELAGHMLSDVHCKVNGCYYRGKWCIDTDGHVWEGDAADAERLASRMREAHKEHGHQYEVRTHEEA